VSAGDLKKFLDENLSTAVIATAMVASCGGAGTGWFVASQVYQGQIAAIERENKSLERVQLFREVILADSSTRESDASFLYTKSTVVPENRKP
jgi:hypothetical protein